MGRDVGVLTPTYGPALYAILDDRELTPPLKDGPGYTGHVSDAQTGLSYMQQRYYDPQIGRFLSLDPVTVDANTGGNFNRYWYANNNPYKFTDPDGRQSNIPNKPKPNETGNQEPTEPPTPPPPPPVILGDIAAAGRVLTGAMDTPLGAISEAAPTKVGDFAGTGIIKRWEGATKTEVKAARAVGKLSQGVSLLSMGISAWDFKAARNAGDTPGMVTAGTSFGFGAIGLTPWGAPGSIAYGATSLVMDTPLGQAFKAKIVDGACSATGDC